MVLQRGSGSADTARPQLSLIFVLLLISVDGSSGEALVRGTSTRRTLGCFYVFGDDDASIAATGPHYGSRSGTCASSESSRHHLRRSTTSMSRWSTHSRPTCCERRASH